jgi:hypothetical protein
MKLILDKTDFDRKMKRLVAQSIPAELEQAMGQAGAQLLNDSVMQTPTVPLKEGTLRGSGSVFVQNKLKEVSPFHKSKGTPAREDKRKIGENETLVVVGFNTPYAARLHEGVGIEHWSEPGSGKKYLETKLANNRSTYMKIAAARLKGHKK